MFQFVVVLIRVRVLVSQFDSCNLILVVLTNEKLLFMFGFVWWFFQAFCVVCQCELRFAKFKK